MIGPVYLNFGDKGRLPVYDGDIIFDGNKEAYYIRIRETRYSIHRFIIMYKRIGDNPFDDMWFQTSANIFTKNHHPIRKKVLDRRKKLNKIKC